MSRGFLRRDLEDDVIELEAEGLNRFVDVITVTIANVLEGC